MKNRKADINFGNGLEKVFVSIEKAKANLSSFEECIKSGLECREERNTLLNAIATLNGYLKSNYYQITTAKDILEELGVSVEEEKLALPNTEDVYQSINQYKLDAVKNYLQSVENLAININKYASKLVLGLIREAAYY